jgi:putative ABC transport system substrate-binding protein
VIAPRDGADAVETGTGLLDGLAAAAGQTPEFVIRTVGPGETDTAAALAEMRVERVDLIVAIGEAAATQVRNSAREIPVVFAAADAALAAELRVGGNSCVVAGLASAVVFSDLRRLVPGVRRIGVVLPAGDEAAAALAKELRGEADVVVAESEGATPEARAAAAVAKLVPGTDAVWLPPSVSDADAAALAKALEGRGVPLVGSRRAHLDAGCAIVLRNDPRDLGSLAAVLAREVLAGADPGKIPVRRARRRLIEVNLPAARLLGLRPPLTLLAWADTVVRPGTVRR